MGSFDTRERAEWIWKRLGDIPVNGDGEIEERFYVGPRPMDVWPVGTPRETIWHWFEDTFGVSVASDLMGVK